MLALTHFSLWVPCSLASRLGFQFAAQFSKKNKTKSDLNVSLCCCCCPPLLLLLVFCKPRRGVEFAFEFARFQHFKRRLRSEARAIKNPTNNWHEPRHRRTARYRQAAEQEGGGREGDGREGKPTWSALDMESFFGGFCIECGTWTQTLMEERDEDAALSARIGLQESSDRQNDKWVQQQQHGLQKHRQQQQQQLRQLWKQWWNEHERTQNAKPNDKIVTKSIRYRSRSRNLFKSSDFPSQNSFYLTVIAELVELQKKSIEHRQIENLMIFMEMGR